MSDDDAKAKVKRTRVRLQQARKALDAGEAERKARRRINRTLHGKVERDRRKALAKAAKKRLREIAAIKKGFAKDAAKDAKNASKVAPYKMPPMTVVERQHAPQ